MPDVVVLHGVKVNVVFPEGDFDQRARPVVEPEFSNLIFDLDFPERGLMQYQVIAGVFQGFSGRDTEPLDVPRHP